ncbi:MAG: glycosyltransferase [Planctomycetes bacterium]|nr:glycosyltransferase [Planctomycetota bacterium]
MTRLSVVVPVWNQAPLVRACLRSVFAALEALALDAEVIVVDDASTDGARELVAREFPAARLLAQDENRGFARAANAGLAAARGELLLLLNSDTELDAAGLARLVRELDDEPALDLVAPRLVEPDGATQRALMAYPRLVTALWWGTPLGRRWPDARELARYAARAADPERDHEDLQPPAAAWLVRRAAWTAVGPFDEALELFFNDVDWCRRLVARGGRLRYVAAATVLHHGGASTRARADFVPRWQTDRLRYYRKHFGLRGALVVKLAVSLTFADWWVRNALRRMLGRAAEPSAPTARAFAAFLRA